MDSQLREKAFLVVVEQYKRLIYKVSSSYSQDPEDRKDLIQEIVLQLWKSYGRYDKRYKMSTWIYRISLNVSISHLRKSSTRTKRESTLELDFIEINNQERSTEIDLLYQFINQFDRMNRALIILYLDDISYAEIATILGITETNVATKLSRIKQKLREKFENIKSN